ncbi:MAG: hypothetical protein KDC46_15410 [Thermoleophilia bacterium]|nr:hypothetical protein [Thermoleophilia bacterium]
MTDFTIIRNVTKGALRFADSTVTTRIAGDAAKVAQTIERGVANPIGKIPMMGYLPIGQGSFFNRVTTLEREAATGGGIASLHDAVAALHNLGSRHGVDGIMLNENPGVLGMLKFKGELGYGGTFPPRISDEARRNIDRAARLVQEFVDAKV